MRGLWRQGGGVGLQFSGDFVRTAAGQYAGEWPVGCGGKANELGLLRWMFLYIESQMDHDL